nr:hypothetical protein [Pseudoalteromonas piscicida]
MSVLAFVKGQETYIDKPSHDGVSRRNGQFDIGEFREEFDLSEAFLDTNENFRFDKAICDASPNVGPCSPKGTATGGHDDIWIDNDNNGFFNQPDGRYNGLLCSPEAEGNEPGQCSRELVNVFSQFELVMSGDDVFRRFTVLKEDVGGSCTSSRGLELEVSDDDKHCDIKSVDFTAQNALQTVPVTIFFSDLFGNPLPAGTVIEVSTNNGELASGTLTSAVGNTNTDIAQSVSVTLAQETEPNNKRDGFLTIKFTYPALGDSDEQKIQTRGISVRDAG